MFQSIIHSSDSCPLPSLFLKRVEESKFWLPPVKGEGESEKLKKGGGSRVQGQVFLKGEAETFPI